MTLSLIHFNPQTGLAASICATGGVAVGGYVNHSWRGVGCCATQGLFTNPWYPQQAHAALSQGQDCNQAVALLKRHDPGFEQRQCMVMDSRGHTAFINGNENIPYVGSIGVPHVAVAGNMLAGHEVLSVLLRTVVDGICDNPDAVLQHQAMPSYRPDYEQVLPELLVTALEAALGAGGDKRGTRSASLRVESLVQAPVDVRVDWSEGELIDDLRRVLTQVRAKGFADFLAQLPIR